VGIVASATAREAAISNVPGIRFSTNARQHTEQEDKLKAIQGALSGGIIDLPSPTTLPHLSFYSVATVDGDSGTFISLWVPKDQQADATKRLEAAGFTVS
jgi:hypothetical protein